MAVVEFWAPSPDLRSSPPYRFDGRARLNIRPVEILFHGRRSLVVMKDVRGGTMVRISPAGW